MSFDSWFKGYASWYWADEVQNAQKRRRKFGIGDVWKEEALLILLKLLEKTKETTEEQSLVAEKIAEIENSSLNEIEKAEKMEEIAKAVAETTGSADVIAEAEKFKDKK